jgi:hypothetical protein
MKPSEFYEQYWRLDYGDGILVAPPKLSEDEKKFLDEATTNPNCQGALFIRKRKRPVQVNVEVLKREMSKFPEYFIPEKQPKLDKWGQIMSEDTPYPKELK